MSTKTLSDFIKSLPLSALWTAGVVFISMLSSLVWFVIKDIASKELIAKQSIEITELQDENETISKNLSSMAGSMAVLSNSVTVLIANSSGDLKYRVIQLEKQHPSAVPAIVANPAVVNATPPDL